MPVYEFKCEACGHEFELLLGLKDAKPRKCPECGKLKVKKLVVSRHPAVLHMRYSNAHPRHMRGQRKY